jgi:hypothetical protein
MTYPRISLQQILIFSEKGVYTAYGFDLGFPKPPSLNRNRGAGIRFRLQEAFQNQRIWAIFVFHA